jgi:hypothetical protein
LSPEKENTTIATTRERSVIPPHVRGCFWDCDPDALTWEDHADFIIARVLSAGSWDAIQWLRSCAGDQAIAGWLRRTKGGGLSGPRLRFWEVILDLPHRTVSGWMQSARRSVWEERSAA